MVKFGLQIKVRLENLTDLKAHGSDFRWHLQFKCMNCGEEAKKYQYVTLDEVLPLKGGRGQANFVSKCKLCSRENYVDIQKETLQKYTAADSETFKTIIVFDCRGMEPIDFGFSNGFIAVGEDSGTKFMDIDLSEDEWVDYDEKAKQSVGIYELEHRFVKV